MVFGIIYLALAILQILLLMRIVLDVTESFARHWRPKGIALIVASAIVSITDPPLRWLRRKIKPLDLGGIRLDLSFLVLFIVVIILKAVVANLGLRTGI
ncbi:MULTISPECIES: YggT family protein [Micrococcaceae]|uniref:YggT family protein n=1 Tax=Micrococcaceae TaxID=1268 RepID=UPI000CFB4771|nr:MULTISPECIES: YggT family protein [unclassified Arthrobacter]MCS3491427.1 YggT family protein [Arthrobacter sp. JUb119]PQZ89272.1 YggT family protein [Arthrobacter sp. MYb222]PRB78582.1 YggT family protein [Arthrobacter sp. MYb214]